MFNTPESANAAIARYEAQPEITAAAVEGVAEFITACLAKKGRLNKIEELAHDAHATAMHVAWEEEMEGADESNGAYLSRLALADPAEAGIQLEALSRKIIESIADIQFEDFVQEARDMGYITEEVAA